MITVDDFKFHPRDPSDRTWTETLFIIFSVPEVAISGSVYTLARPNMGVCHSSIEIHRGLCFHPWQIHHADAQMHLPCPTDFSRFTLDNGLSFEAFNARDSRFQYQALDGRCAFDLTYRAICAPFDPHDPADNTLLTAAHGSAAVAGYEGWYHGHMESIGHTTGTLRLHGRTYAVDCVDGMDKSWGPRPDWGQKGATWMHVTLGPDFGAFLVFGLVFDKKEIVYGPFKFGFIAEQGTRRVITKASMLAQRRDLHVTRAQVQFTDDQGRTYDAVGTTIAGAPWYNFNPSAAAYQTLLRFECEGRVGYSHIADFAGLGMLSQGMADEFAD